MKRVLSIVSGAALVMAISACANLPAPTNYANGGPVVQYKSNLAATQTPGPAYASGTVPQYVSSVTDPQNGAPYASGSVGQYADQRAK